MNSNATRSTACVVRLADLDDLHRPPPVATPQPMNEFHDAEPPQGTRASSNDSVAPSTGWGGLSSGESEASRTMHPIGSTLPGTLSELGGVVREPWPGDVLSEGESSRLAEPDAYFPPRDVPRLPKGRVLKVSVHVDAKPRDYARVWLLNMALMLVTLGLAWPWAYRRRELYFLRHTRVASHRLDFRLSAGVLWPRYATMLALWAGVAGAMSGSVWAGLAGLTLGCAVWPMMAYLKINQRVASVTWAGRRLWFDGTWQGMSRAMLVPTVLSMAVVWTGGLAWRLHSLPWALACGVVTLAGVMVMPLAVWRHFHYRQNHLRLGPLRLQWKASRGDVAGVFLRAAAVAVMVGVLTVGTACVALAAWLGLRHGAGSPLSKTALVAVLLPAVLVTALVTRAYLQARLMNLVWNHTGNRHLRFRSRLPVGRYVRLSLRNAVLSVLTLGLYLPWAEVSMRALRLHSLKVTSRVDPDTLLAYWSRRQGEAPPTAFPSAVVSQGEDDLSRLPTQPAVAARHGPPA